MWRRRGSRSGGLGSVAPVLRLAAVTLALALTCGATASAQGTDRWIEERAPLNIAHQGGEDEFPSNTMYAFRKAFQGGTVASKTLRQIKRLDGAYWFAPRARDHYSHDLPRRAYRFRGIATGRVEPPKGFRTADFRVPTLKQVLKAFPRTPINVEIKGRTPDEATEEYVHNAEVLARLLRTTERRNLIVASFQQDAVDRFHQLVPRIDVAPGIAGAANWLLSGGSPGPGVAVFQLPITFEQAGTTLQVTTAENVARAHSEGYAWHNWFSGDDRDAPGTWRRLIDMCVDGIMTSRSRALERVLRRHERPASCG
jgi:glycerophosphoryl diester phosphodiesterase